MTADYLETGPIRFVSHQELLDMLDELDADGVTWGIVVDALDRIAAAKEAAVAELELTSLEVKQLERESGSGSN